MPAKGWSAGHGESDIFAAEKTARTAEAAPLGDAVSGGIGWKRWRAEEGFPCKGHGAAESGRSSGKGPNISRIFSVYRPPSTASINS
jgi:hypothetical protein